jgi:hypothetical protein
MPPLPPGGYYIPCPIGLSSIFSAVDEPHDVILLPRTATADDLSDAIGDLLAARRVQGDTAHPTGLIRIRRTQTPRSHPRRYPWAGRVFTDLRTAPLVEVSGVGRVRELTIWLPPQRTNSPPQQ